MGNRFRAHQFNKERTRQTRWIWRGVAYGTAALTAGLYAISYSPNRGWVVMMAAFSAVAFGLVAIMAAMVALSHMPEPEYENTIRVDLDSYAGRSPILLQQTDRRQFTRIETGLSGAEWAHLSWVLRQNGFHFSRSRLKALRISNERFAILNQALKDAGIVVNNRVPEHMRHYFDLPTPDGRDR